jgi:CHAP domain
MSRSRHITILGALAALVLTTLGLTAPAAVAERDQAGHPAANATTESSYACNAPFGSVQIPASAWAGSLVNTGHDGATFDVYSDYRAGRSPAACAGGWESADGTNQWGLKYQCTELAVRVADGEWGIGNNTAWINAGWNGAADAMKAPGQRLGLTWTSNGTGSLPVPGDLMIWSSSGGSDPGHVAVVSAVGSGTVTFVGENQGYGMVTLPVSGSTVENDGWKTGSSILGWLSHTNPNPPLKYVYHVFDGDTNGVAHETYWGGGNSLTTYQLANVGSPIASIQFAETSNGVYHVFDGDTNGEIHETYWGGGNSLTTYQLANVGSPIASIQFAVTPDGTYHVFDGDTNGEIHETYWGGGNSLTTYQLASVGSPIASIQFAVTSNGVYHVFDGDSNGAIHETYWGGQGSGAFRECPHLS